MFRDGTPRNERSSVPHAARRRLQRHPHTAACAGRRANHAIACVNQSRNKYSDLQKFRFEISCPARIFAIALSRFNFLRAGTQWPCDATGCRRPTRSIPAQTGHLVGPKSLGRAMSRPVAMVGGPIYGLSDRRLGDELLLGFFHFREDFVQIEAGCLLPLRVLAEGR